MMINAPKSEEELLKKAQSLIGCTFGELAQTLGYTIDLNSTHSKGKFGQLIEMALGAYSGSLAQPDFNHLNIELKTLPISEKGLPQESTYICTAPIPNPSKVWRESLVYKKMAHILWVPYLEANPITHRKICAPLLWHMTPDIEKILKQDWEELTEYLTLGQVEKLSAHLGTYLQIRPKAADSKTLIQIMNQDGEWVSIVPKGFYIRSLLTKHILEYYV
jgi:DNA mismatch repair protein MutH